MEEVKPKPPSSTGIEVIEEIHKDPGDEEEDKLDEAIGLEGLNEAMRKNVDHRRIMKVKDMLKEHENPVAKVSGFDLRVMLRDSELSVETEKRRSKSLRDSISRVKKVIGKGQVGPRARQVMNVYEACLLKSQMAEELLTRTRSRLQDLVNTYQPRAAVIATRYQRRAAELRQKGKEEKKRVAAEAENQQPKLG